MKIILSEKKIVPLMLKEFVNGYSKTPYFDKISSDIDTLKTIIQQEGKLMINILTNKDYMVYEIKPLMDIIGKRYGICQLIKDGVPSGTIFVKPMVNFKNKII